MGLESALTDGHITADYPIVSQHQPVVELTVVISIKEATRRLCKCVCVCVSVKSGVTQGASGCRKP